MTRAWGVGVAQIKVKDVYLRVRTYDFCSRAVEAERIALALTKLSTDKLAAAEAAYGVFAAAGAPAAAPAAPPSPMVAGMITLVADSSSLEVRHPLHTALPSYSRRASVQANDRFRAGSFDLATLLSHDRFADRFDTRRRTRWRTWRW